MRCSNFGVKRQLIPTVVGGVLAIAGGFFAKFVQDQKGRKSLKCAFAAEIRAFLNMLEHEKREIGIELVNQLEMTDS
jgi:hypothetical protein